MTPLPGACIMQTPYHAALLFAAGFAAVAASASSSSCDADTGVNHKVKHQDLKNSDPVAWARDSSSEFIACNSLSLPRVCRRYSITFTVHI